MKRKDFLQGAGALVVSGLVSSSQTEAGGRRSGRLKPARLNRGDTIGFVAPAGIVYEESEFNRMEKVGNEMGFKVVFGEHVRSRYGYLSGTDRERATDLNRFFADPQIHGIIAVRGGWGCNRIIPLIDFEIIRKNPKFFCGFSDITSLHLSIHHKTGLVTFHGPNGTSDWTPFTRKYFLKVASGQGEGLTFAHHATQDETQTITPGTASGKLIGGNLTLVSSLAGTKYFPDPEGAILFLEDIGEDVYRVDRMLSQLKLGGVLDKINGFVFGICSDCKEGMLTSLSLEQVFKDYLKPLEIPAFYGARISHEPDNFTVPVGIEAQINAGEGTIKLLENPVSQPGKSGC